MTMVISELPMDLLEEILSRVPVKSMGAVRSTCKKWNAVSKDKSFTDKQISKSSREKEFLMITRDHRVYLINVNLYKTRDKKFELSVKRKGTLMPREDSGEVISINHVYQWNGLLLCALRDIYDMFVVWNPYSCERRWIKWPCGGYGNEIAFGYDRSSCDSYKILTYCYANGEIHYEIYDSNSHSWRVIDCKPDQTLGCFGVSLKGDYYSYVKYASDQESHMLSCFDFTKERFGPRLPLSIDPGSEYVPEVYLSGVGEDQLGLLVKRWGTSMLEFRVTNKVEPDVVSWRHFLKFDMNPVCSYYNIGFSSFYIVEEENIVVLFGEGKSMFRSCIIGENGYFTKVDLRKCIDIQLFPFVGSYVR